MPFALTHDVGGGWLKERDIVVRSAEECARHIIETRTRIEGDIFALEISLLIEYVLQRHKGNAALSSRDNALSLKSGEIKIGFFVAGDQKRAVPLCDLSEYLYVVRFALKIDVQRYFIKAYKI